MKNDDKFSMILVGNKSDLDNQRSVSASDGQAQASNWGIPYVETSAKTKANVDKAFYELLGKVKSMKGSPTGGQGKKNKKKSKSKCIIL